MGVAGPKTKKPSALAGFCIAKNTLTLRRMTLTNQNCSELFNIEKAKIMVFYSFRTNLIKNREHTTV